jgi:hypothetical protein
MFVLNQQRHNLIMNPPDGMMVDHINNNPLDNRKCNLRICTRSQNNKNRSLAKNNTSGYTGVTYNKADKVWRVTIYNEGKRIQLGSYKNIEDAITVRQEAEKKYYGEFRNIKGERIYVQSCDVE